MGSAWRPSLTSALSRSAAIPTLNGGRAGRAGDDPQRADPPDRRRDVITITAISRDRLEEVDKILLGVQDELLVAMPLPNGSS
jgi:hypothetical protein